MENKISLVELLEAGCHFGHQTQRWNPKAASFIYSSKQGIHIIDLVKTKQGLISAMEFIVETVGSGGKIIFLGTKRQAKDIVKNEALRCGAYYIVERWPGGLLTNFEVMKKNLLKMKELREKLANKEEQKGYTKKEIGTWEKELKKLELMYGGIAELSKIPEALFVIDTKREAGAIKEAKKTGVKIIGMVDTNSDPTVVDFPIPANDDAVGSIKIIVKYIADAVAEGLRVWEKKEAENGKEPKVEQVSKLSKEEPEKEPNKKKGKTEELKERKILKEKKTAGKSSNTEIQKEKKTRKKLRNKNE